MFRFLLQKLVHKKWMVLCLLIGNILMIAVASSYPLYQTASFQKMLDDEFKEYMLTNNTWPAKMELSITEERGSGLRNLKEADSFFESLPEKLGLEESLLVTHYHIIDSKANSTMNRDDSGQKKIKLGTMLDLKEHVEILYGSMYKDDILENGNIEAIVSLSGLVEKDLLLGETLCFENILDPLGEPVRVTIVGVFTNSSEEDLYWQETPDSFVSEIFIADEVFETLFLAENSKSHTIKAGWSQLYDSEKIRSEQVQDIQTNTKDILRNSYFSKVLLTPEYVTVLANYLEKVNRIQVTLLILQVPLFVLLCAFLFMISNQMLQMEQNEISLLKSRGAKKAQIIGIYLYQSIILTLISVLPGLFLGMKLCELLGSANAFLEFVQRRSLSIAIVPTVYIYVAFAMVISILMTILPVFKYSKVTIVHLKQDLFHKKTSLWKRLFLDLILLGISLYGYYSYAKNSGLMINQIVKGQSLDPLLYMSSSLFLLGGGLFMLRLQPLLIQLLFIIRRKTLRPAAFAAYLQSIRSKNKQQFIMLFMILTVALGIFQGTVARTIIKNAERNLMHQTGADLVIQEVWKDNSAMLKIDPTATLTFYEPDFDKYRKPKQVTAITKVFRDSGYINYGKKNQESISIMGIHTKDFGENTEMEEGLLPEPYFKYLNDISQDENGILASMNLKTQKDYQIGDEVLYYLQDGSDAKGIIYGFFEYWPGYTPKEITIKSDGVVDTKENYLIVGHLSTMQNNWGVRPYEVWMNFDEKSDFIYEFIEEEKINVKYYVDTNMELTKLRRDPLFQGTNGVLTMSFLVILLLCTVGYLIYWVLSIRSRDLLFGVLRAMGMSKWEIFQMLFHEQIFSGVYSILAGSFIGILGSRLYVPMLQTAYAAANQVLPLKLITDKQDLVQLFSVVFGVLLTVMFILAVIISKLNITKALKLGED